MKEVRARYLFERREVRGTDAPLASATRDGVVLRDDLDQGVWNPGDDVSMYKLVEPGDFVIGLRSFQHGLSASVVRGLVSPAYTVLRSISPEVDGRFFAHYFRSAPFINILEELSQGIRQGRTIPYEGFANLRLPVPALEEQRRIADFLDEQVALLDRAVALRQRQAILAQQRRLAWCSKATTSGLEEVPLADTGVTWMPHMAQGWALRRLGGSFRTGSGTTPTATVGKYFDGPHPWLNTGDLRDSSVTSTRRTLTDVALADFRVLRFYPPGSLVVAMYGATVGRLGLLEVEACVNQACCVLYGEGAVLTEYAFYWLLAHRPHIIELAVGAGQPNISQEIVRSLRIPTPGLPEQRHIVNELRTLDRQVDGLMSRCADSVRLLLERRQALITAAVTGQLDVATAGCAA